MIPVDLKKVREEKGITLKDIFVESRVSMVNLEAIENEDYEKLPSHFISKAFIKTYASAIGIEPDEILESYNNFLLKTQAEKAVSTVECEQESKYENYLKEFLFFVKAKQRAIIRIAVIVLLVCVGIYTVSVIINNWSTASNSTEKQGGFAANTSNSTANASQIPTSGYMLSIEATEATWLKIARDKNYAEEFRLAPGDRIERVANETFVIDAGINVIFQGKGLGALGKRGGVIHITFPQPVGTKSTTSHRVQPNSSVVITGTSPKKMAKKSDNATDKK